MNTLHHDAEIRSIDQIDELNILPAAVKPDALKLAKQVVSTFDAEMNLKDYKDDYAKALQEIIKSQNCRSGMITPEVASPAPVVDLMDALRKSLGAVTAAKKKPAKARLESVKEKARRRGNAAPRKSGTATFGRFPLLRAIIRPAFTRTCSMRIAICGQAPIRGFNMRCFVIAAIGVLLWTALDGAQSRSADEEAILGIIAKMDQSGPTPFTADHIFWSNAFKRPTIGSERGEEVPGDRAMSERLPGSVRHKTTVVRIEIAGSGDLAYEFSNSELSFDLKDGKHVSFPNSALRVWKKEQGMWKVAAQFSRPHHENTSPTISR
jgi:hypothetical protein